MQTDANPDTNFGPLHKTSSPAQASSQAVGPEAHLTLGAPDAAPHATGDSKPLEPSISPTELPASTRVPACGTHLTSQQLQFLLRVTPGALQGEREYEIPACITIAQAILESATPKYGWGSSTLFRLANNPFGIKYRHFGPGDRSPDHAISAYGHFDAATWEIVNGQKKTEITEFQCFPNLDEAFRAHALLLRGPRYQPAFAVRADWKQFAERLGPKSSPLDTEHCGYSTNPSYSAELIELVTLYRLNDPRALQWFATGEDPGPAPLNSLQLSAGKT